jgi:hypothetical protein
MDHDFTLDVGIAIRIGRALRLSVTRLPLLGSVLVGLIVFVVSRQVFVIDLPRPVLREGGCD